MVKVPVHVVSAAGGLGAGDLRCGEAPAFLKQHDVFSCVNSANSDFIWQPVCEATTTYQNKVTAIAAWCVEIAMQTQQAVANNIPFLILGGDHSCAIGSWSGAAVVARPLGLIWVDAHMDSHTFETTPSGNIHGMPLAALLGYGDAQLTQLLHSAPKVLPEHLCLIGVRSFEPEEAALLRKLNVRVFYMDEIQQRGIDAVFAEALAIVRNGTAGYGISFDLDGLDPQAVPGVGSPVADGILPAAMNQALAAVSKDEKFLGLEIVEFNPYLDKDNKTFDVIVELIKATF